MAPATTPEEVLSDGLIRVEIPTTVSEEAYDIQIQGSDRTYPAIVLRRKYRGVGATIRTISKFGQHSEEYADYEQAIRDYVVRRKARRQNGVGGLHAESGGGSLAESWLGKAVQGVVKGQNELGTD